MSNNSRVAKKNSQREEPFSLQFSEVESSRTSLASKTYFKVLGLGLEGQVLGLGHEASSPTALFFELLKFCGALEKFFGKRFFVEIA